MTALDLYTAIYDTLIADAPLAALVGTRIALVQGEQDDTLPRVNYRPESRTRRRRFFNGGDEIELTFFMDVYADAEGSSPESAVSIHDAVIAALDGATPTAPGWSGIEICGVDYGGVNRIDEIHFISSQWRLTATEA